jgi:Domain of unknown function (DUF4826)
MSGVDYDDRDAEKQWCETARGQVARYLQAHSVSHGQIGEWPAWHVVPYVSIWAVESRARPGWVGWWVICGDLPTDYVPADVIKHPREAVRAIASRWRRYCAAVRAGSPPAEFEVRGVIESPDLIDLLEARAELLDKWADDNSIWESV